MRPLLLNLSGGWGGLEMFSAEAFEELLAADVDACFIALPSSPLERRLLDAGHGERVMAMSARKYFDLAGFRSLRRILRQRRIDLIHTFKSSDIFYSSLSTLGFERRVALVHHLQMLPGHSRRDPLYYLVYRRLDCVLTITRQIEERVGELWPVARHHVRTLYYGLEAGRPQRGGGGRERARERFGLPQDALLLALVGQVCEIKGQRFVLEVFAELADEFPQAQLAFAGAPVLDDPSYAAAIDARITELGLEDRVHQLGFCAEVGELMPAFDVFVLGSRDEPFGRVVIEAMAAGCLMVASAAGGPVEIVDDGKDGFLYPSRDRAALKQTLRRVLTLAPEERDAIRERAQRKVAERFSMERFSRELLDVYREVLALANGRG